MEQEKKYIKIAKLISSELSNSLKKEDRKYLDNWLSESIENRNIYDEIKKDGWYQSNLKTSYEYKTEEGWNMISSRIQSTSKIIEMLPSIFKYCAAAIVIGILTTTFMFSDNLITDPINTSPIILNNTIGPGTDKATLTLGDGAVVKLEKGVNYQTANVNSNGQQIVYVDGERNSLKIIYNYLTIPRGGQFFIKLSDGTQVWLNSESQLKYPVRFIDGKTRRVELVYGEAYFDVSPSTNHEGSKFKVINRLQEIEVLGTEFNVKAYRDETTVYTTLVKGKVAVSFEKNIKQNLIPNQQSIFNQKTKDFLVIEVDVYNEISWKEGVFSFERKPLKEIMKVLSRWYDMEVVFNDKSLEDVRFFGVLGRDQNIKEILETIKKFKIIKSYEIKDKVIMLK